MLFTYLPNLIIEFGQDVALGIGGAIMLCVFDVFQHLHPCPLVVLLGLVGKLAINI